MTSRPRSPRGHSGGNDDDGAEPPDEGPGDSETGPHGDESGDDGAVPRGPGARSIAEAQNWIDEAARRGRAAASTSSGRGDSSGPSTAQAPRSNDIALQDTARRDKQLGDQPPTSNIATNDEASDPNAGTGQSRGAGASAGGYAPIDPELRTIDRYERLGDQPPKFTIERNDVAYRADGAHTVDRHGPGIPLPRDLSTKTIEGRIYGDTGWDRPENWSYRWTDPSTMNRTVRDYIHTNWEAIRCDLAMFESHEGRFDAGHRIGEGYYNSGMYGAGARAAQYATTSFVTIRVKLIPGSDPPEPFIVTAFPAGLL